MHANQTKCQRLKLTKGLDHKFGYYGATLTQIRNLIGIQNIN